MDQELRIILIANKAENAFIGPYLNDCYDLGVGDPVIVSAGFRVYSKVCMFEAQLALQMR